MRSRETFKQIVSLPDLGIPLAEAALLMACEEYPHLSLSPYLDELDRMAERVQSELDSRTSPMAVIDRINHVLFEECGFEGNSTEYYDPRNSFLNEVMDRRTGIPITLSTIYIEVAQRMAFPIEGVGIPGHFIVKYRNAGEEIFIDPFNGGSVLTRADCRALARNLDVEAWNQAEDRWLNRATNRGILQRMIHNLKMIYLKSQTFDKALAMVDLMILTEPRAPEAYRDRGLLRLQVRQFRGASQDLERYLRHRPDADDRSEIEGYLRDLARIRAMMN